MINYTIEELENEKHILVKKLLNKYDPYILKRLRAVIDAEQHFYRFKESYYRLENMNERANDYKILIKCNEKLYQNVAKVKWLEVI